MAPWDWKWEEPSSGLRTLRKAPSFADASAGDPTPDERRFRRRRLGAGIALIAIVALLLTVIHSHHSPRRVVADSRHPPSAATPLSAAEKHTLEKNAEQQAIASVLSYTPVVVQGGTKGKDVALTFDDGPGPYTLKLVETLDKLHVHATFFAIGEEERYFSPGSLAELRAGDVIGNHTETHPMMAKLSRREQRNELLEQTYRIQLLGGPTPRLFRPPYGSFDATTLHELHSMHLLMILWSTDTADFTLPGVPAIVQRALAGAHPGAIILMHDAGGNRSETIAALPAIVRGLRKRGLEPVTIPRLLLDDPPPRGLPIPPSLAGD